MSHLWKGNIPPAEYRVLGAILAGAHKRPPSYYALQKTLATVSEKHFSPGFSRSLYQGIIRLWSLGDSLSLPSLYRLITEGECIVGWAAYLLDVYDATPTESIIISALQHLTEDHHALP